MTKSHEILFCKNIIYVLGRDAKENLFSKSNLDDRERKIMQLRFINGLTTQEVADKLYMPIDTFNKVQKKAFVKLYEWIQFQMRLSH